MVIWARLEAKSTLFFPNKPNINLGMRTLQSYNRSFAAATTLHLKLLLTTNSLTDSTPLSSSNACLLRIGKRIIAERGEETLRPPLSFLHETDRCATYVSSLSVYLFSFSLSTLSIQCKFITSSLQM